MNLCTSIGKRQYANEVHISSQKLAKLNRFARITLEKSIETDQSLLGSKSTNHGVHLPIDRWAFRYDQGLNCPSSSMSSSSSSSSSCSSSLVPIQHPYFVYVAGTRPISHCVGRSVRRSVAQSGFYPHQGGKSPISPMISEIHSASLYASVCRTLLFYIFRQRF